MDGSQKKSNIRVNLKKTLIGKPFKVSKSRLQHYLDAKLVSVICAASEIQLAMN